MGTENTSSCSGSNGDIVVVKSQKMADGRSYALRRCRDCAAWLERAQKPKKNDGTRLKNKAGEPIKKRKKGAPKVEVPLAWKKMSFTDEWAGRGAALYRGVVITRLLGANKEGFRRRAYAWLEAQSQQQGSAADRLAGDRTEARASLQRAEWEQEDLPSTKGPAPTRKAGARYRTPEEAGFE